MQPRQQAVCVFERMRGCRQCGWETVDNALDAEAVDCLACGADAQTLRQLLASTEEMPPLERIRIELRKMADTVESFKRKLVVLDAFFAKIETARPRHGPSTSHEVLFDDS